MLESNGLHPGVDRGPVERTVARRNRSARLLLPAAASVIVVLLVVLGACAVHDERSGQPRPAGGADAMAIVGTRWHLTAVRSATRSFSVPAGYRAELAFGPRSHLLGQDGLNALAGTYRASGDKITLRVTEAGTAGGTAASPAQQAMSSLYAATSSDAVTSTFMVTPTTLTLVRGTWTLTFDADAGGAAPDPEALPSSTSTHR